MTLVEKLDWVETALDRLCSGEDPANVMTITSEKLYGLPLPKEAHNTLFSLLTDEITANPGIYWCENPTVEYRIARLQALKVYLQEKYAK